MLFNLSLVMEFLGNVFTVFIFEKLLSPEALVTERVTANSNNSYVLPRKGPRARATYQITINPAPVHNFKLNSASGLWCAALLQTILHLH